jgi:hypothetical protein
MEVNGQLHYPAALLERKEPQYSLDRRLGGSRVGLNEGSREESLGLCRE